MSNITPIRELGNLPEAGRIRTGVKQGRGMRALDTFRFTSVDKAAIEELATLYGGTVKAWQDDRANPPNQWEVISEADTIEVAVQPGSVDVYYEMWSKGGLQRRCDGEEVSVWIKRQDDVERKEQPCICGQQGLLECQLKTRVALIFPSINFSGTWRYESSGRTVANTVPGMLAIVEALQSTRGLLPIEMTIVKQEMMKAGQKRKFSIVQFRSKVSVDQMLAGSGTYQAQVGPGTTTMAPALASAPTEHEHVGVPNTDYVVSGLDDDEVVEAELVDDDDLHDGPSDNVTPIDRARQALAGEGWPKKFPTKGEAMACARENPGKVIKKDGTQWEVR